MSLAYYRVINVQRFTAVPAGQDSKPCGGHFAQASIPCLIIFHWPKIWSLDAFLLTKCDTCGNHSQVNRGLFLQRKRRQGKQPSWRRLWRAANLLISCYAVSHRFKMRISLLTYQIHSGTVLDAEGDCGRKSSSFTKLTEICRQRQDDFWTIQKVRPECRASIECQFFSGKIDCFLTI